jgi:hypothetical protein
MGEDYSESVRDPEVDENVLTDVEAAFDEDAFDDVITIVANGQEWA